MVRRGYLLLEAVLALGILATAVFGGMAFLSAEASAVRGQADRAVALAAADAILAEVRAHPPVPGRHPRTLDSLVSLREGRAEAEVLEEAPGLLKVSVTVRWQGPESRAHAFCLDSLVRSHP